MPTQRVELFSLNATTPEHTLVHGAAALSAVAEAGADLRRGIDLSLGFDFTAVLSGEVGEQARASVTAGASARAGLALQATVPLDLFGDAGIVARFRAQVELAAFVRATVGLAVDEFYALVRDHVPDGPMTELLGIFLDEVVVEAGVWARASFSAQVLGEAAITGTLNPNAPGGPGFTAVARYALGWGAGAGIDIMANVGIEDPRRLLDRLGRHSAAILVREARAGADRLDPPASVMLRGSVPVLDLLLPLAMGTAFQVGFDLATAEGPEARDRATRAVVRSFVEQAQRQLLRGLVSVALEQLAAGFGADDLVTVATTMPDAARDALVDGLVRLRDDLAALDELPDDDLATWVDGALRCVDAADEVVVALAPVVPAALARDLQRGLATLWAAGTLLRRVVTWASDPAAAVGDVFGATPLSAGPAGAAATVNAALGRTAGDPLTMGDLASYLVGGDLEAALRTVVPDIGDVLELVQDALATPAGGVVRQLLVDLSHPGTDVARTLLTTLGAAVSTAISDVVVPHVLTPLRAADPSNAALAAFVDEVVVPTLTTLPGVVLPTLPGLDRPEEALRLREALSAVLLQSVSRFVVTTADVLFARGLRDGADATRALGAEVQRLGEASSAFGVVAMVASRAVLPLGVTPADIAGILRLVADVMDRWNDDGRPAVVEAVSAVLAMGFADDEVRAARLAALLDTDGPPSEADLGAALDRTCDALWEIVAYAGPRLLELLLQYFVNQAKAIAAAVYDGAKAVVTAAIEAAQWVGEQLVELGRRLARLAHEIARVAAEVLADVRVLSAHLRGLLTAVLDRVREAGRDLIEPLVRDFPDWVRQPLLDVYDGLFDAISWLMSLPLLILESVAGWVEDILTAHLETAGDDHEAVHAGVRDRIRSSIGQDVHFDLSLSLFGETIVDIGRVTIPAGQIAGILVDTVLGDEVYDTTVRTAASRAVGLQAMRAQETVARQAYDDALTAAQAHADAARLVPGGTLVAAIDAPADRSVHPQSATVLLRLDGANDTFVRPVLGVPARARLRVNGVEVAVPAAAWRSTPSGLAATLRIRAPRTAPRAAGTARTAPSTVTERRAMAVTAPAVLTRGAHAATLRPADGGPAVPAGRAARARPTVADELAVPRRLVAARAGQVGPGRDVPLEIEVTGSYTVGGFQAALPGRDVRTPRVLEDLASAREPGELPRVTFAAPPDAVRPVVAADGTMSITGLLGVNSVQLSVTDGAEQQDSVARTFFVTDGPPEPATGVRVVRILHDPEGFEPQGEYVELWNTGPSAVDLTGWTLRDLVGHTYRFPSRSIAAGATLRVWTGLGTPGEHDLYWGRRAAVWNNRRGDVCVVSDARGRDVDRYGYTV